MGSGGWVSGRVWGPRPSSSIRNLSHDDWGPWGPVHALREGGTTAACGEVDVRPTGGPWPPADADADEPLCLRCRRAAATPD